MRGRPAAPRAERGGCYSYFVDVLNLENHCRSKLTLDRQPWASGGGYLHAVWLDPSLTPRDAPPRAGERTTLYVGPPFEARRGEWFYVPYFPAQIAYNGWDPGPTPELDDMRVVRCCYTDVLGRAERPIGRSPSHGVDITVEVSEVLDPLALPVIPGTPEVDVTAWPVEGPRGPTLSITRGRDRLFFHGSIEGDITFSVLTDERLSYVALVEDTSICQDFFWFGKARPTEALRERLARCIREA